MVKKYIIHKIQKSKTPNIVFHNDISPIYELEALKKRRRRVINLIQTVLFRTNFVLIIGASLYIASNYSNTD